MRRRALVLVLVLALAACGEAEPDLRLGAGAGAGGNAAESIELTCGDPPPFPAAQLDGEAVAQDATDAAAEGLRSLLASDASMPQSGWHRVAESEGEVRFVSEPAEEDLRWQAELHRDGAIWEPDEWGQCELTPYRDGFEPADWQQAGPVAPGAKRLRLSVTERGCASGQPPGDRLQPAEVVEASGSVTITFWVRYPSGNQDCPGNPPTPVTVELAEPLGERVLLDGGTYPAREVGGDHLGGPITTVLEPTETTGPTTTTVVPTGPPPADPDAAKAAIDETFHLAFDAGVPDEQRFAVVEDGGELAEVGRAAAAKYPEAAASISVTVHSVTFVDATHAAVNFELLYEDAMLLGPQDGEAVFVDGGWKVSRATRCRIIEQAGVSCP